MAGTIRKKHKAVLMWTREFAFPEYFQADGSGFQPEIFQNFNKELFLGMRFTTLTSSQPHALRT